MAVGQWCWLAGMRLILVVLGGIGPAGGAGAFSIDYTYDSQNRLATVVSAEGTTTYTYDEAGNRASLTYPNETSAHYEYDEQNRLTRLTNRNADGSVLRQYRYTLGPAGNREAVHEYADESGTQLVRSVAYAYDRLYRLKGEVARSHDSGQTLTEYEISYDYDTVGNRTLMVRRHFAAGVFLKETRTVYDYDEKDRLVAESITETVTGSARGSSGEGWYEASASPPPDRHAGGILAVLGVTAMMAMLVQACVGGLFGPVLGRRARRRRLVNGVVIVLLAMLMLVGPENVQALHVQHMLYQAVGAASLGATTRTITHEYDDNGNLTATIDGSESNVYVYDAQNRLVKADVAIGGEDTVTTYTYDADGTRTGKAVLDPAAGGDKVTRTYYLVDKNAPLAQVVAELDGAGAVQVRYVHGDDLISQTRDPAGTPTTRFYHYDGQMSTRMLTDHPADPQATPPQITDEYAYEAFGTLWAHTGDTPNDFLYTGQQLDANTGFYYLRARYYHPGHGRFITLDTYPGNTHDPLSLHRYLLVGADPVNKTDPSGHGWTYPQLALRIGVVALLLAAFGTYKWLQSAKRAAPRTVTVRISVDTRNKPATWDSRRIEGELETTMNQAFSHLSSIHKVNITLVDEPTGPPHGWRNDTTYNGRIHFSYEKGMGRIAISGGDGQTRIFPRNASDQIGNLQIGVQWELFWSNILAHEQFWLSIPRRPAREITQIDSLYGDDIQGNSVHPSRRTAIGEKARKTILEGMGFPPK